MKRLILWIMIFTFCLPITIVWSAIPIENDFNTNMDGFVSYGNAIRTGNAVELTGNFSSRKGSFFTSKGYSDSKFTVSFDLKIGPRQVGGDGLTFAFVKNPGVGGGGSDLGFSGLTGYAIEFDTYGEFSHKDHVALIRNSTNTHIAYSTGIPTLTNSTWYHIEIQFDNGRIQVWLDNIKYLDHTIVNFQSSVSYFGCTAATGGETNNHTIDNFSVSIDTGPGAYFLIPDELMTATQVPFEVPFTDYSAGSITSWLWDFGDGSSSNEQNPMHTYTLPGVYSVSLTITNDQGTFTEKKNYLIHAVDWIDAMIETSSNINFYAYPYSYYVNHENQYVISAGDSSSGHGRFNVYSVDGTIIKTVTELRGLPYFWVQANGNVFIGDGFDGSVYGQLSLYSNDMQVIWSAETMGKPREVTVTPDGTIIYSVSVYNENKLNGNEYTHNVQVILYAFDLDGTELWSKVLYTSTGIGHKSFMTSDLYIDKNNGVFFGTGSSSAGEGFLYSVNKEGVIHYEIKVGGQPRISRTSDGSMAFITTDKNVYNEGKYESSVSTITLPIDLFAPPKKYSKEELDQVVAEVSDQKDQIIVGLNSQMASMFTQTQLDTAVKNMETAKDTVIESMFTKEQIDHAVTEAIKKYDIDGDEKLGFSELIYIMRVLSQSNSD